MSDESVKRICDAQAFLGLLSGDSAATHEFLFRLRLEREAVDAVAKVVLVAILQIWHEVVNMHSVGLERPSGRQVEVADNLVDANFASHVATFVGLLLDLVSPALRHALMTEEHEVCILRRSDSYH